MATVLPWIIIGIAVAVIFAFRSRKKTMNPKPRRQNVYRTYWCDSTGLISLALEVSSLLIGEVIGFIDKNSIWYKILEEEMYMHKEYMLSCFNN